jgi:hypothetical protein
MTFVNRIVFVIGMASGTTYAIFGFWKPLALFAVARYFRYDTIAAVLAALAIWNGMGWGFHRSVQRAYRRQE